VGRSRCQARFDSFTEQQVKDGYTAAKFDELPEITTLKEQVILFNAFFKTFKWDEFEKALNQGNHDSQERIAVEQVHTDNQEKVQALFDAIEPLKENEIRANVEKLQRKVLEVHSNRHADLLIHQSHKAESARHFLWRSGAWISSFRGKYKETPEAFKKRLTT